MGGGIKNTQEVDIPEQYSLDACQNNPDYPNSLRQGLNEISTNTKGYYKIGLFYVYRHWTGNKQYIKVDLIPVHELVIFYGEYNNHPYSGVVATQEAIMHNAGDANAVVTIDRNNSKIIFTLLQWSSIILISTSPITGIEIY